VPLLYLRLTDVLCSREFFIYLFSEALLCVSDDAKKTNGASSSASTSQEKLRLKGRVFIRHIGRVDDTSEPATDTEHGENSLTISMVGRVTLGV
jgi:hypothetical protein